MKAHHLGPFSGAVECGRVDPKRGGSGGLLGGPVMPLVSDARLSSDKSIGMATSARKRPYMEEKVDYEEGQSNATRGGAAVFVSARDQLVRSAR